MKEGPDSAIALLSKDGGCSIRQRAALAPPSGVIASGLPDEVGPGSADRIEPKQELRF